MANVCPTCGSEKKSPRSVEQHRRFFGVLRAMYANWPERHEFQPENETHLRKWILCKAKYRTVETLTLPQTEDVGLAAQMMMFAEKLLMTARRGGYSFARWRGLTLAIYEAESIAFDKLAQDKFNRLNDDVEAAYLAETGLNADQLLQETERAA